MNLAECHPNRKHKARGLCAACYDKWLKETNPQYKSNQKSNTTKWCEANPEKWKVIQERRKLKEKQQDPSIRRNKMLQKTYGISLDDYTQLLEEQGGGCALCGRKPGRINHHVDHDHVTGKVRGILCHQCNWFMGTVDADPTILDRIKEYR